jgi:hypothetical protein
MANRKVQRDYYKAMEIVIKKTVDQQRSSAGWKGETSSQASPPDPSDAAMKGVIAMR